MRLSELLKIEKKVEIMDNSIRDTGNTKLILKPHITIFCTITGTNPIMAIRVAVLHKRGIKQSRQVLKPGSLKVFVDRNNANISLHPMQ